MEKNILIILINGDDENIENIVKSCDPVYSKDTASFNVTVVGIVTH